MKPFEILNAARQSTKGKAGSISNLSYLDMPDNAERLTAVWMYPDVLTLEGGRGDLTAMFNIASLLGLPFEIVKCRSLTDRVPMSDTGMIFFPPGDLAAMADICAALMPQRSRLESFAKKGGHIIAIGGSGSILAKTTRLADGTVFEGLGLLDMTLTERDEIFGDDLWLTVRGSKREMIATQIQRCDVALAKDQAPFADVRYGRGNDGGKLEGARTQNVIFTHALGPALVRTPLVCADLLLDAAKRMGITPAKTELASEDIAFENEALDDLRTFIKKKIAGEIVPQDYSRRLNKPMFITHY